MKEFETMNEAIVGMHIIHAQRTKNYDSTNAHFVCFTLDVDCGQSAVTLRLTFS